MKNKQVNNNTWDLPHRCIIEDYKTNNLIDCWSKSHISQSIKKKKKNQAFHVLLIGTSKYKNILPKEQVNLGTHCNRLKEQQIWQVNVIKPSQQYKLWMSK